jgi:hypothetical protein
MKYLNKIKMIPIVFLFIIANTFSCNSHNTRTLILEKESLQTSKSDTCVVFDVNLYATPFNREININELKVNSNLDSISVEYKENAHNSAVVDTIFKFYIEGDIFIFSENVTKYLLLGCEINQDIFNLLVPTLKIGTDYDNNYNTLNQGSNCNYLKFVDTETESFFIVSFSNNKIIRITYFPYFD